MTELESRLKYQFKEQSLLKRCLTHKSFANELKVPVEHNEKLEFLGDAVIDLVIGEMLYFRYPQDSEGNLSKKRASLVNEEALALLAVNMGLDRFMQLGKGEIQTGGMQKPRLLASTFEALIGALYLDAGFDVARKVLWEEFKDKAENLASEADFAADYKTRLQEVSQKEEKEAPLYELILEEGPPHDRTFKVCVKIKGQNVAEGQGRSKKNAEQMAAKNALKVRYGI